MTYRQDSNWSRLLFEVWQFYQTTPTQMGAIIKSLYINYDWTNNGKWVYVSFERGSERKNQISKRLYTIKHFCLHCKSLTGIRYWLWHSLQSGCFKCQRTAVRIQSSVILFSNNCIEKSKIKKKEAGYGQI